MTPLELEPPGACIVFGERLHQYHTVPWAPKERTRFDVSYPVVVGYGTDLQVLVAVLTYFR